MPRAKNLRRGDVVSVDGVPVTVVRADDVTEAVDLTVRTPDGRQHTIPDVDRDQSFPRY